MAQFGFYFDSSRCTGCKTCELACKDYNDLDTNILFRKVYDFEGGEWKQGQDGTWTTTSFVYNVSAACNFCDTPACVAVCPVEATTKDEETGLVQVDSAICIGCGRCAAACPYEVPKLDAELKIAKRCDGCIARVRESKKPICVEACPLRALEFDEVEKLRSKYGTTNQIPPLPSPSLTHPNLVIKPSPALKSPAIATGIIANPKEI